MAEVLGLIAVCVSGAMLLAWAVQGITKHGGTVGGHRHGLCGRGPVPA